MENRQLIEKFYKEAVKDIKEDWLLPSSSKWYEHILSLDEKSKITYLISILDQQVFNGGFDQYFKNGYGQFAQQTIIALKKIQSNDIAELLNLAYEKINIEKWDDAIFRKTLLNGKIESLYEDESIIEYLNSLTDKYIELNINLEELLGTFLKS